MSDFGNILLVLFGIGLLIYVHELGHYLAARAIGVRVEVFSLGFGPRIGGFRRGPTDYRISLIPLGGYVAVAGMEPSDHRYPRQASLHSKTVGQRFLFYSGGVFMNLLFALIAFPIAFGSGVSFLAPEIGNVRYGGAAWEARLESGDQVLKVNGKPMYSFDNLIVEIALAGSDPVDLQVRRGNDLIEVTAWPQYGAGQGLYVLGVDPALAAKRPLLNIKADGPAAQSAGLSQDDELLAANGVVATSGGDSSAVAAQFDIRSDDPVEVRVLRGEAEHTFTIQPRLAEKPSPPVLGVLAFPRVVGGLRTGLPMLRQLDLRRGDIVLRVDGAAYRGPDLAVAENGGDELAITVLRGDEELVLKAPVSPDDRAMLNEHVALVVDVDQTVVKPVDDGAAQRAGLLGGDRLVSINGTELDDWDDLRDGVVSGGTKPLRLEIERAADREGAPPERLSMVIVADKPQLFDFGLVPTSERKRTEVVADGFADAVRLGCVCSLDLVKQLYVTLKKLITGDVDPKNLGGPVRIFEVSYHTVQWGLSRLLYFLALLSINLAFINVLPIPVLDGGHLAFLLIEKVKGSPVSTKVLNYSQILGLVFVLALVVFVTYNDILRLL